MTTKPKNKTKPEKPAMAKDLNPAITVAIITGVVSIIVAAIALLENPQILTAIFPPPPATPTATPIPFARIQSLDVIQDGNVIDTVNPGGEIIVTTGSNVVVKVNIISNTDFANLVFIWEFCESGNDVRGQGAIEIPYRLSTQGQDCIAIKIEKGGAFLDTANFLVSIR